MLMAAQQTAWLQALGRFHVVLVHFPIALLFVAAMMEGWRILRRQPTASPNAVACLVVGAASAVAAAAAGWIHNWYSNFSGEQLKVDRLHQWMGVATAAVALLAIIALLFKNRGLKLYRYSTIACAILVGLTGHLGGTLTHGDGYLTELLFQKNGDDDLASAASSATAAPVMPIAAFPTDGKIDFAKHVQPIFANSCYECHSVAKKRGGLRMDSKKMFLEGGNGGKEIVPGKSAESLLLKRVRGEGNQKRMPIDHPPLPEEQIKILAAWVDQGASWPDNLTNDSATKEQHWAYKKPERPKLPEVKDKGWVKNGIDAFVLARLEKEGLKPSAEADRPTLIRRLSLDLTGLPPKPEEVDSFVNDPRPDAYERLVDRLLASPHYGERWGRHWLDIARYADTNGYEKDNPRSIWPYRDWVIKAINEDVPYDQFVIQQIAGDMLPGATADQKIATGFHRNTMFNEEGGIDVEEFRFKSVVDRVQTTSTAFMGLTMHCAQCHNHKYDQISQKEYYQFFAMLNNADEPKFNVPSRATNEQRRAVQAKVDQLTGELASKFPSRDESIRWEVLTPEKYTAKSDAKLELQKDKSLLATGPVPDTDTYVIQSKAKLDGVIAVRLEVLTDPSLPRDGPGRQGSSGNEGRNKNGNFVLSQILLEEEPIVSATTKPASQLAATQGAATRASTQANATTKALATSQKSATTRERFAAATKPAAPRTRIKIERAEADHSQKEFDVSKAIDDYFTNGWAIAGAGQTNKNHYAVFYTPQLSGEKNLVITLKQLYKKHTLGKFRISVGRKPAPLTTQPTQEERTKFLAQKLEEWEQSVKAKCAKWTVLDPSRFTRKHDATITKLDDKSLLFTGDSFYREEYKLEFDTDVKNITAMRVELLPDEALPKGGPGRDPNGGCLMSEMSAVALEKTPKPPSTQPATRPVEFASASADAAPDSVARAIDGAADTHWAVPGGAARRTAVFKLKQPLSGFDGGTTLALSILQNQFSEVSIGRMRVSVTSDAQAEEASGLPDEIEKIVLIPKEKRTAEQTLAIRNYFLGVTPLLAAQQQEIAQTKASMPQYTTTLVMEERSKPRVTKLHHRGEYLQPREPVDAPAVPAILPALPEDQPKNRLTLARWLVDQDNPLIGRVTMNRVWNTYFGRGIVSTIDDFGIMGEKPSHPELLDWLATELPRQHWSMKAMHKLIVTSSTYRQSSRVTPELQQKDPQNVLLTRGPRLRVEAEVVRDIALSASGLLAEKVGGPSVYPPQPPGIENLSYGPTPWVTSTGEERYRRGMYTFLKRTALYPGLTTFDAPTAEVTCTRRIRSNTPLQALTTLNDTVFVEAAQHLAQRLVKLNTDVDARIREAFRLCIARPPEAKEVEKVKGFYESQLKRFKDKSADPMPVAGVDPKNPPAGMDVTELAAWTTVSRAILNLDETVTRE
jgi:uncharacterized membrane protein/mono/diheme cytochrome c family protein